MNLCRIKSEDWECVQWFKNIKLPKVECNWDNNPMTPNSYTIKTKSGRIDLNESDWIVYQSNGIISVLSNEDFNKTFILL